MAWLDHRLAGSIENSLNMLTPGRFAPDGRSRLTIRPFRDRAQSLHVEGAARRR
jgi:hypothetical protein